MEFFDNPHLEGYRLTVTHNPELDKKLRKGYVASPVILAHVGHVHHNEATLGWVVTMGVKRNEFKIMTNCFGRDNKGFLVVRDKYMTQALAEYLGQHYTVVSNRACRCEALVKWAIEQGCGAIYTPEGYDDYLLDRIKDEMIRLKFHGPLLTYLDGGIVVHYQHNPKVTQLKRA